MHPDEFHPGLVARNSKQEMELQFEAGGHPLSIPVLVARGEMEGPTLVVSAGVHGDEYEGIQTIFDVFRQLEDRKSVV